MTSNSSLGFVQLRSFVSRTAITAFMSAVLIGFYASPAEAQWTTNGNNITNTNTGNVGIGTTGPGKKLVVQSDTANDHLSIVRPSTNAAVLNIGIDNTGPFIESTTVNRPISFYTHNGTSVAERVRIDKDGNLGIGTTAPSTKLEVVGNINAKLAMDAPSTTDVRHIFNGASAWLGQDPANGEMNFGHNLYYNNGFKYRVAAQAANIRMYQGAFQFQTAGTGSANGAISWTDRMVILTNGQVGIATTTPNSNYKLDVNGNTNVTGDINASGTITGGTIEAKYQDVAEWVPSTHALLAGTVVTLDPSKSNHVEASTKAYDTRVAGVVSGQPGIALGEQGDGKVLVATTGRVKIKVDASAGPIQVGDLLVTSSVPGVAMKSQPIDVGGVEIHRPGTLIGKALEPLTIGQGEILVLLSLQ